MNMYKYLFLCLSISWLIPIHSMYQSKILYSKLVPKYAVKNIFAGGLSVFAFGMYHEVRYRKTLKDISELQGNRNRFKKESWVPLSSEDTYFDGLLKFEFEEDDLECKAQRYKRFALITKFKELSLNQKNLT